MTGQVESRAIPATPFLLGFAGLIPFWGLALGLHVAPVAGIESSFLDLALATYGAVILSFLGGIRWGLATQQADQGRLAPHYAIAVLPSLAAWAALALPEPWRLAVLGLLILALGPIDASFARFGLAPPWYARLRWILSLGAGIALVIAALAYR